MEAKDKIIKGRVLLQKSNPFFSYLVMHLKPKNEENMVFGGGVDIQGNLYYKKEFIDGLDVEQTKTFLCHEVMHLALEHLKRKQDRQKEIYNIACDLVVNDMLITNDFKTIKSGLIPENHTFIIGNNKIKHINEKPMEEIYNEVYKILKKHMKKVSSLSSSRFDNHEHSNGSGQGKSDGEDDKKGSGSGQKGKNNKDKDNKESNGTGSGQQNEQDNQSNEKESKQGRVFGENIKQKAQDWKKILTEAYTFAKMQGNVPNGVERMVDGLLESKLNWKELLYKYIIKEIPYDYTYSYPHKKSASVGVYMPSVVRETVDIMIAIDTSGSISQEELKEFLSEIIAIAKSFSNVRMTLIVADCKVHKVYEVCNGNIEKIKSLKMVGGGGTSHIPVYDWILKNKPNARLLVAFTDGWTDYPDREEIRTLWVICKDGVDKSHVPFGQIIKL